jgi:hypothetical protein
MKYYLSVFILVLLVNDLQAYREPHGTTARSLAHSAMMYAMDNDEVLPETLEEIPELEALAYPHISRSDIFYLAPDGATMDLPATTPLIMIQFERDGARMQCIAYLAGNIRYFRETSRLGPPRRTVTDKIFGFIADNPLFGASGLLNVILLVVLGYACLRGKPRELLTNRRSQ